MSEEAPPQAVVATPTADTAETQPARPDMEEAQAKDAAATNGAENKEVAEPAKEVATAEVDAPVPDSETKERETTNDKQPTPEDAPEDKAATAQADVEMKEDIKPDDAAPAADDSADAGVDTAASADKSKARRKSGGVPEHKNKKLNKKASKAKMTHIDAKPGDYFYVRLKGYPPWPTIICDESMLPNTLIKSRPVTAARPDGTYRPGYEDGGSKVKDRTFPVMYLYTNEFGWVPNTDLVDLDLDTVGNVAPNMRKDLHAAHLLAAEKHDLDYFKQILKNFMEQRAAELEAKEAAKAAKKASKAKRQSKAAVDEQEDGDVDMADAPAEPDSEEAEAEATSSEKPKKGKKRKAEDDAATPQRGDSAKKPKTILKLTNNTPKTTSTPKTPKDQSAAKSSKPKAKKAQKLQEEAVAPKEPELTPEQKRLKKEKEILFLRHKLQKGLLIRGQEPKEEDMKQMSEFVGKLEDYADLEVSIIRATKINKVLKAILKLSNIPKEEVYNFKGRSQTLLDKWTKILATDQEIPGAAAPPTTTNGDTQEAKPESEDAKATPAPSADGTNGAKESPSEDKAEEKAPEVEAPVVTEPKDAPEVEDASAPPAEEPAKESVTESAPVESTA